MSEPQNKTAWWRPAILIFGRVSIWVAIPLVAALLLGKYLDAQFGTRPFIFLGLTVVAFFFSSLAIVRIVKKYIHTISPELPHKKEEVKEDPTLQ